MQHAILTLEGPCLMQLFVLEKICISKIFALCKFLAILFISAIFLVILPKIIALMK